MAAMLSTFASTLLVTLTGCGQGIYDEIDLMPPPAVYRQGAVDPFPTINETNYSSQTQLFYVTDRRPATAQDRQKYYANERGYLLRAGTVEVRAEPRFADWDEVRSVSLSLTGGTRRKLKLAGAKEIGILPVDYPALLGQPPEDAHTKAAGAAFASAINQKLAVSRQKDIFLYIHGYNVDFDYSVLVGKELQHYLGYRGAFVVYGWPSTPSRTSYFGDLETAEASRRHLRLLIEYLTRSTDVERIHIIAYSAGVRLAFEALYDFSLQNYRNPASAPGIGKFIMIGAEIDRAYFAQSIADNLLVMADEVTVYMSGSDSALDLSSFVFSRRRLGQIFKEGELNPEIERRLRRLPNLHLIDVSEAEDASVGNGHWYFRSSPWVSSDIFLNLLFDLPPSERGLTRGAEGAIWHFTEDYDQRVQGLLAKH